MSNPEIEAALALARERWEKMFPVEDERAKLASWDPPHFVPGLGLVAAFSLFEARTNRGPSGELIVVPLARMGEPAAALDELAATLEGLRSRGVASQLDAPLEATVGLAPARYTEGMFATDELGARRRAEALASMNARFEAVATRMKEVYGLRLPRYLATFAAFWRSLDDMERQGMSHLGRSPGGIMIWFEDGGLERKTRGRLDPRLECRFRADPPELVTVMWGDSDGLHHGLWYDDPADPPTCIAHNYARDSAETWRDSEPTPLAVLAARARELISSPDEEEPAPLQVYAALAAIEWFEEADRKALAEDPPAERWLEADRIPTLGTFGPALPPGAGSIRVGSPDERVKAWKTQPPRVQKWIESAKRDCAEGRPAAALTFGLDLHWLDKEEYRDAALELLVMAYEKLGRRAHAETVKVHYAHRDLRSVGVFLRPGEEDGAP
ncbi:ADP-ribosylation family protein [Sorangium sp. So ce693]|uniref:ADP-ribosylation family protein n=1 Tax=Sorangium sp. So ce693 TaxID=3133318 RepID=UPI003F5FAFFE